MQNNLMISILIFFIILISLVCYIGFKLINKSKTPLSLDVIGVKETLTRMENDLKFNFSDLNNDQKAAIEKWTEALIKLGNNDSNITELKQQLEKLKTSSENKFEDSLLKLTQTFAKLEENVKNVDTLKTGMESLNKIFYSTKDRGNVGEFALNTILTNILGENSKIWTTQSKLSVESNKSESGNIDALINMGEKEKIAIDAKFPLKQYQAISDAINNNLDLVIVKENKAKFKSAIKDKIKEVKKYVNAKNNITQAILFIPSEAIFSYLNSEMQDIFIDSFSEKIWISSPTTLAALLYIIFQVQKDHELSTNLIKVKKIITEITNEYIRLNDRWNILKKNLEADIKAIKDLDTTFSKIQNKQIKLDNFKLDE